MGWIAGVVVGDVLRCLRSLIAPRLAHSDPIVRAVATLGFALMVLGFCEFMWGEWPRSLRLPTDTLGFRGDRGARYLDARDRFAWVSR